MRAHVREIWKHTSVMLNKSCSTAIGHCSAARHRASDRLKSTCHQSDRQLPSVVQEEKMTQPALNAPPRHVNQQHRAVHFRAPSGLGLHVAMAHEKDTQLSYVGTIYLHAMKQRSHTAGQVRTFCPGCWLWWQLRCRNMLALDYSAHVHMHMN